MELSTSVTIPEGVQVNIQSNEIFVKGSKGELNRNLIDKDMSVKIENQKINLGYQKNSKKQKKQLFSTRAHLNNIIKGASEGFTYKLKICSGHFPMSVNIKGQDFEVKNFIGESVPRRLKIKEGVKVKIDGDIITVEATDKELAGQAAGSIEKLTKRPGFDNRIFQDGLYIIEKGN
jgi:large subunit ribosomal protein L6